MRALSSGTTVRDRLAEPLDEGLVAEEEEGAVARERSAERAAELVAVEVGLVVGVEEVARVERVVAVELVDAAVELVGARLGQDVDLPARVAAELGAVGVRLDPELANRLHAERRAGGAAGRAVGEVVLQRAVEQVHVRARILTVDAHAEPVRDDRAAVAMRKGQHARLQQREVGVVAAVERQLLDRVGPDEITELGAGGVHERRVAGDRHFDRRVADLERDVQRERLRDRQLQLAADVRLEARELGADVVTPGGRAAMA